jgi:hypothetical protein
VTGVSYDDLVAVATVGLSHRTLPLTGPSGAKLFGAQLFGAPLSGVPAEHVAALEAGDQGTALLDAAALMVSARRAGARPAAGVACPEPAPPDQAPELPARAAGLLVQALALDELLLADLLTVAARAGYRAPAPLLPRLLDAAVKRPALRPAVAAGLGARGRWLAGHRPEWQRVSDAAPPAGAPPPVRDPAQVTGDLARPAGGAGVSDAAESGWVAAGSAAAGWAGEAADIWETGRRGERRAHLEALRGRDPAAARDLLAAGWSRETGDDRADLLTVLADGLSGGDEEFLETALDDRKATVRAAARALLGALPGSAFTRRAVERAAPLLRVEPRTVRRDWLVASLPEVPDEAAVRDGIVARPPGSGIGAQAWLLTQLIAAVPLAEWVARFGRDEAAIVALPVSGGLGSDVRAGWRRAAVRQGSQPWAKAILSVGEPGTVSARPAAAWTSDDRLAEILPPAWRAERAVALLAGSAPDTAAVAEVARCPGPWPDSLAAAVMAALSRAAGSATRHYWPDQLAAVAGRHLPVTGEPGGIDYAAALERLAGHEKCLTSLADALRQAAEVIRLRRSFATQIR